MGDTPDSENKPIENGLSNESEDSGNTSEQEPCLPSELKDKKDINLTDTLDSKHLDSEIIKQNKKRHNVNKSHVSSWASVKNLFAAVVKYLKEKTGLSNIGLVVVLLVLLVLLICIFVILFLIITQQKISHEFSFPICRRSACLRASSQILPRLSTNVSACDDFREYACGQWLRNYEKLPEDRSAWSLRRELEYNTRDRIRQIILTQPHPIQVSSFAWKTKYFYDSCMDLDTIESARIKPLTDIINLFGGWHVLRTFLVHAFDLRNIFTRLHSQYGVSLFIKVDVVPDPKSEQDFIIQILPASLGLPDKSYYYRKYDSEPVTAYKQYLQDITQILGATSNDAASFSDDIFFFEKRLAEITPDSKDVRPLEAANRISVGDLQDLAPSVPLHDVLLAKYPEANIDVQTQVWVPFPDHLRNISNLISTTDRSALNNYMMWRLTDNFLPYLNERIRNTSAGYRSKMFGEQKPLQRWEMCIETMQKFMGFGLTVLLQNHTKNFSLDVHVVEVMFKEIREETKHSIYKAGWLPPELLEHINGKLTSMVLEVGLPSSGMFLSISNLEDIYRQMYIINRDFFQNIKYGINFLQLQQQLRLNKFDEIYRWVDAASNFDLKVHYIAAANRVIVPQALLQEPFFHREYPLAVLYGSLGVEISTAVVQAISPWDILYADAGTLIDRQHPAVNQSEQVFLHPLICLRTWWGKEGFASTFVSNKTTYNALIKLSGVKIALRTLNNQLSHLPHTHQPALESYEDGHLFFITFAQSICSVKSRQQKDLDHTLDVTLDDKALLSVVPSQVKEFTKLFSCSAVNVLYSEIPCEDIL